MSTSIRNHRKAGEMTPSMAMGEKFISQGSDLPLTRQVCTQAKGNLLLCGAKEILSVPLLHSQPPQILSKHLGLLFPLVTRRPTAQVQILWSGEEIFMNRTITLYKHPRIYPFVQGQCSPFLWSLGLGSTATIF